MSHRGVGIVGYGVYIPWERIETEKIVRERERKRGKELEKVLEKVRHGLLLKEKALAGHTEDTITIATEAAENAVRMAGISPDEIRSGRIKYGLAIGADVAQAERGDPLEYSCGAGAGAYVLGRTDVIATIEDIAPFSSLFMDFWRRDQAAVPSHFGRTTVEAYKSHVIGAIANHFRKHPDLSLSEFDAITFHQPSGYLPMKTCAALTEDKIPYVEDESIAERMRLTEQDIEKKVKPWLKVLDTGNTYAASTLISLASVFDNSKPGDQVLAVSY